MLSLFLRLDNAIWMCIMLSKHLVNIGGTCYKYIGSQPTHLPLYKLLPSNIFFTTHNDMDDLSSVSSKLGMEIILVKVFIR